ATGLSRIGFAVLPSFGSYFITADFAPLGFTGDDQAFCRHITQTMGVAAIPVSAFYETDPPRHYARFAFCKQPYIIDEAIKRLGALTKTGKAA
ncbi:MAG: aminotransferase, partial [Acidiphilium sp. 21-62-4]